MAENRTHTLHVGVDNALTLSGVVAVDSITDREATIRCDCGKVIIKGDMLVLHQLDSDRGQAVVHCNSISSISYASSKRLSVKSLFGS